MSKTVEIKVRLTEDEMADRWADGEAVQLHRWRFPGLVEDENVVLISKDGHRVDAYVVEIEEDDPHPGEYVGTSGFIYLNPLD